MHLSHLKPFKFLHQAENREENWTTGGPSSWATGCIMAPPPKRPDAAMIANALIKMHCDPERLTEVLKRQQVFGGTDEADAATFDKLHNLLEGFLWCPTVFYPIPIFRTGV
jgi:hypothetical protein